MDNKTHKSFPIDDRSYLSLIKKDIKELSELTELTIEERGKLDIIATEMCTNLIKYADKGRELLIKPIIEQNKKGIEIISLDRGPGISDISKIMQDGYSTSGSKGEGLGAIKRLSDEFDIYSLPGKGTVVVSRIFKKKITSIPVPKERFEVKGIMIPIKGEEVCGDSWDFIMIDKECSVALIDGLGHGPNANIPATEAVKIFNQDPKADPFTVIANINEGIKKTRGAVGFVGKINAEKNTFTYCGIGNISCRIFGFDGNKTIISFNGILGLNVRRFNNNSSPWDNGKLIILHSDGLGTRWDLNQYPGILQKDLSVLTTVLYRDYSRQKDDVTVIAIRNKR